MLDNLHRHFTSKGVPVIISEFGAANKDNTADRAEYAGYIVKNAASFGIKCFRWDTGCKVEIDPALGYYKGMALYDRYRCEWIFPEIVEALTYHHLMSIHNCIPFYDHTRPWVTHCCLQRQDLYRTTEYVDEWRRQYGKPVIVDGVQQKLW